MKRTLTRVSTLAKANDDASSLHGWKQEMALRGIRSAPDLQALLATMDPDGPKDGYRKLAKQAEERAAAGAAANLGTAIHSAIELAIKGGTLDGIPPTIRRDAEAVLAELKANGLKVLASETFVVVGGLTEYLGGSFDHLVQGLNGSYILDVKTSNGPDTPKWAGLSWATQEACYAHGRPYVGPMTRDRWTRPVIDDVEANYADWPEKPDQSMGIVAHVVRGSGVAELLRVDLDLGWAAAQTACEVRALRKANVLM